MQSREREERQQMNKRRICLGLTQSARQRVMQHSAFPVCICKLTLAWISSETSIKLLRMPTYADRTYSLLWTSSHPTGLSAVRCRLASRVAFFVSLCPTPFSHSLIRSGHAEISSPKPFVRFRTKTDKGIVCLSDHLHSVTSTRPLIFKSSSPSINPLVTVRRATITIGINVTFKFHFFSIP